MSLNVIGIVEVREDEPHSAEWVIPANSGTYSGCSKSFSLRMSTHCDDVAHCPEGVDVKLQVQVKNGLVSFYVGLPSGTRARWAQWIGPNKLSMRSSSDNWVSNTSGRDPFLGKRYLGRVTEHAQGDVLRLGVSLLVLTRPGQFPHLPSTIRFEKAGELGSGSFGSVLKVTDTSQPEKQFCAKTAKKGEVSDFSTEAVMMRKLRGEGFAELLGHFQTSKGEEVLVLQRLHRTLESLRTDPNIGPNGEQLSAETVITVGIQLIRRLRYLHDLGFVHNDLKPENIMIDGNAAGDRGDVLYLIDFGLSRHWRIMRRHVVMPTKDYGLMGTVRYCSIYAHKGMDSRRSDMESLAHLLIYLAAGSLPWQGLRANRRQDRDDLILQVKNDVGKLQEHTMRSIPSNPALAKALLEMVDTCRKLPFDAEPTYDKYIQNLTAASTTSRDPDALFPLDWVVSGTRGKLTKECSKCEIKICKHPSKHGGDDCSQCTSVYSCNCNNNRFSIAEDFYADSSEALHRPTGIHKKGARPEAGGGLCGWISGWLRPCLPCV